MIRLILCLTLLCGVAASVAARVEGMNQRVFEAMDEAQTLLEAEDYAGAMAVLDALRQRKLTSYETAHVLRFAGMVHYESGNLAEALAAHEQALAQPRLPESMVASLLGALGRLALAQENYPYAETRLVELLAMEGHDTPTNQVLLAVAHLRQDEFAASRDLLLGAIAQEREKGNTPAENWLSMLVSAYYSLEDYAGMRTVLAELVQLYPRERYVMNLAAVYGQLGERQRQLALVESLEDDERLEQETQLKMLANLFLAEGLPYKAALLLQAEIDAGLIAANAQNLELLSQAWYMAHDVERALPALERAGALADSGELYLRLAGFYMDLGEWENAAIAAGKALERGGLRREGNAWLLRGMARVRLNQLNRAEESFHRASDFEESGRYAEQWLAYVANQRKMRQALASD